MEVIIPLIFKYLMDFLLDIMVVKAKALPLDISERAMVLYTPVEVAVA
jgi:hypothetical protein